MVTGRVDLFDKILGRARYVEDYAAEVKDLLYARIYGSEYPHALIEDLDVSGALKLGAVAVITYKDIPGTNAVGYIPEAPILASKKVRFAGEPIAIVVAKSYEEAEKALEGIRVKYMPLKPVTSLYDSLEENILVHDERGSNVAYRLSIKKGNVNEAFEKAYIVVSNTYKVASREHAYIEREAALAIPNADGSITVIVPNQNPHIVAKNIARVLSIDERMVKVITPLIGGSFGGKNDMGIYVGAQAALAAFKVRRPVLLTYSRRDSFTKSTRSEEAVIEYSSAASEEGKILGARIRILLDCGAYAIRCPGILWRMSAEATGPYYVPNIDLEGIALYTNRVFVGAWRGFGTPVITFAHEGQMELLARKLGIDPLELRLKNIMSKGLELPTGQVLDDDVKFAETLQELAKVSQWYEKRGLGERSRDIVVRGIGVGCAWHGISVGGGYGFEEVEIKDWVDALVEVKEDGTVIIKTGIVEMGQGTSIALGKVASQLLGIPSSFVEVVMGTSDAPETGGTHASRGFALGALAIEKAIKNIKETITTHAADILNCPDKNIEIKDGRVRCINTEASMTWRELVKALLNRNISLRSTGRVDIPRGKYDPRTGKGHAWPTFTFSAIVAEVEVNKLTGEVRVLNIYSATDAGRIVNRKIAEAQIEGGIVFGLGLALMEELLFGDKGEVINDSFSTYHIPTLADLASINIAKPVFMEYESKYGFFGAKGIGEIAPSALPAAIASAVFNATGKMPSRLPLKPEVVWSCLNEDRDCV